MQNSLRNSLNQLQRQNSLLKRDQSSRIETWNFHGGLKDEHNQAIFFRDLVRYKIQLACLQETRWTQRTTFTHTGQGKYITYLVTQIHQDINNMEWLFMYLKPGNNLCGRLLKSQTE